MGFPEPGPQGQQRLGVDFLEQATDYWFNRNHPDGTVVAAQLDGWEDLDFVTPLDTVGGRDGALSGPSSIGPNQGSVNALLQAPDAQVAARHIAAIKRILLPAGRGAARNPVVWEQYDHGAGKRLARLVRPTGRFRSYAPLGRVPGSEARVVEFGLVAANPPWKFSSGPMETTGNFGLLNPDLVGGRGYDQTYDWTYGGGGVNPGGEAVAINTGDRDAAPVFTVTGRVDYPIITNATTGQEFAVNAFLDIGQTVVIDMNRGGEVTPPDVRLAGRPWLLAPGANTIRWRSAAGTYRPTSMLRLDWRSTYS